MQGLRQGSFFILFFVLAAGFFASGSFAPAALQHGLPAALAVLTGIAAGSVGVPLLLPWLPGRAFSCKGAVFGLLLYLVVFVVPPVFAAYPAMERFSWLLICLALSSWLGMAFTGASTFTSLHGVRKEMLRAMPLQFTAMVTGIILWCAALLRG
jgi:acetyl-CoA decarbonylase/synthase complex subunit gamma